MSCVLDASALLALLLREPGCERVRGELPTASMCTVNVAEVVAHYARNDAVEADVHDALDPLPFERVDFDEALALDCGMMLPATRELGLSLGDRACLALAKRLGLGVLTADRAWTGAGDRIGVSVELLR
jgi:ribonuclease VapC